MAAPTGCSTQDWICWIHWRLSRWGVSDRYLMYSGGLMSPIQRCFSDLVCQPPYVINAYLCLAMLHVWTLEYQHMICSASDGGRKAERQWPELTAGSPSSSAGFRRIPTLYSSYLRCGDLRSPGPVVRGATQRFTRTTWQRRKTCGAPLLLVQVWKN